MLCEHGKSLLSANGGIDEQRFTTWKNFCDEELVKVFGSSSQHVSSFQAAGVHTVFFGDYDENQIRADELKAKLGSLSALIEMLKIQMPELGDATPEQVQARPPSKNVFVVHGHDEAAKGQVVRVLEKLRLNPVVLHEKENAGKTIIEKFEKHAADAAFAVVLLTPDDEGRPRDGNPGVMNLRARQNVVFELGYFIGTLGRPKVCAIFAQGVELPSDINGVLYIPLDSHGAWAFALAKELKAAGLSVDFNKLAE